MDKKELAIALHDKNYNCAQSVACAFAEEVGVDPLVLFKACEGFGAGMGCKEGTCGALTGAIVLAGFKNSDGSLEAPATKASTYQLSEALFQEFGERCGSTVCKDLKGLETGEMLCSCPDCIRCGVELAEKVLGL